MRSLLLALAVATPLAAQQIDSVRAGLARPTLEAPRDSLAPPISPRRAFLYSFLLPGAGQARLDRQVAGGFFFAVEIAAITFAHRSAEDLRIARSFAGDSMPLRYRIDATSGLAQLDANGLPIVDAWSTPRYTADWVRTRKLHYEDWVAVIVFNHLFAGADAFVAAQLWDLPGKVAIRQTPFGPLLQASFSFR